MALGFSASDGFKSLGNKLKNPFDKYFGPKLNMKGALERNDFRDGMEIVEYEKGVKRSRDKVVLKGNFMPHVPFTFGGEQRVSADYYPGNSEPTVHVLGSKEDDITIKGRFYSKRFSQDKVNLPAGPALPGQEPDRAEVIRASALEVQKLVDAMRIRGNLVRITMGGFQRYGIIQATSFDLKTVADVGYSITFLIVGFNPPTGCKILQRSRTVPFDINKDLINFMLEAQNSIGNVPETMPKSFADQLKDGISAVAEVVNLVTGFVDTILEEVDSIKSAIERAKGLIKHARNKCTQFQQRVGALDPYSGHGTTAGKGVSASYLNATHMKQSMSYIFSIVGLLEQLREQLAEIAATEPLGRHRVIDGDNLQSIAVRFYKDSSQWKEIYDHNKLVSTELIKGSILEIPRV